MTALRVLHDAIDSRVAAIMAEHTDWPCRKGCDACCRNLSAVPELTKPELDLLTEGLQQLPDSTRSKVYERLQHLTPERPVVCPFLNREAGDCLVYEYRPTACRTYGFYVERGEGLYCQTIHAADHQNVVWGNQETIDSQLDTFGERTSIRALIRPALPIRADD